MSFLLKFWFGSADLKLADLEFSWDLSMAEEVQQFEKSFED